MNKQEYLNRFETYLKLNKNLATGTIKGYKKDVELFLNQNRNPETITRPELLSCIRQYSDLSVNTQMHKIASIQAFFAFLVDEGLIGQNVAQNLPRPKTKRKSVECPEISDVENLIAKSKNIKLRLALALSTYCGLRASETISIQINDIDFNKNTIKLWNTKTADYDFIAVPAKAMAIIKEYLNATKRRTGCLLLSTTNRPFQYRNFKKWMDKEVGINPHKFRATCATTIANNGRDGIFIAQNQLRHSSIQTTQRYVKVDLNQQKKIMDDIF